MRAQVNIANIRSREINSGAFEVRAISAAPTEEGIHRGDTRAPAREGMAEVGAEKTSSRP